LRGPCGWKGEGIVFEMLVWLGMIVVFAAFGTAVHFYYGKKEEEERRSRATKN
jgi:hypothetical protein